MSVRVSVIIPIYRSEATLARCIDSVLSQTYRSIEVILVDDGSPDCCGEICENYALIDNRVKVIHQVNEGVSVARQVGMEYARGEYSIHVDSDDWIEPTMIEELVCKAMEDNADMVICDYIMEGHGKHKIIRQNLFDLRCDSLINKMLIQQLHGCCWNKLVRRTCYGGVYFQPKNISYSEDLLSNVRLLKKDLKVSYLDRPLYHYCTDNPFSICNVISDNNIRSKMDVVEILHNELSIDDDDLFYLKKMILYDLLASKRLDEVMSMYPEITDKILKEKGSFNPFTPFKTWLYIAKCGCPNFAYFMFVINMKFISVWKKFR